MTARARESATVAPGAEDRRFRRARGQKGKSRARGRRAIPWSLVRRVVVGLLIVGAGAVIGHRLVASTHLTVQRISVTGNERLASREVVALLEGLRGQHQLEIDLEAWRRQVLESPWVSDARLRRVLPGSIEVDIVERSPLAIARVGTDLFVVDERGEIIDDFGPEYADIDLPIIDGLSRESGATGSRAQARASLVARLLTSLAADRDLLAKVSQIDVQDPRNAIVILEQDLTRVHLGDAAFDERLRSYLELAPALRARVPVIDEVDLRFEPRVFVRPAAGAASAPAQTPTVTPQP